MDEKIFLILYSLPHPSIINVVVSVVSALGSYGAVWFLIGAFLYLKKNKNFKKRDFLVFLIGMLGVYFLVFVLQNFFGRLRPYETINTVVYLGFVEPGGFSFPSFHATSSFFAASFISRKIKQSSKWLYVLALLISFSRIYLGAHYLTDILAGAIIGVVIGKVVVKIWRTQK